MPATLTEKPQTNPLAARVETLTAQLADAEAQLQAALDTVTAWRAKAIEATLRARDLTHCLGDIVSIQDDDFSVARVAAGNTVYHLTHARTAVIHATAARDALRTQLHHATQALNADQHRERVLAANPQLAARLRAARSELARAMQTTGRDAQHNVQQAEYWLNKLEEEITTACRMTPVGG